MGRAFFNTDDTVRRLNNTICIVEGCPRYINVLDATFVSAAPLGNPSKATRVKYTDDTFSYKAFQLGMIFHGGLAHYLRRMPERRANAGLLRRNVQWQTIGPDYPLDSSYFASSAMEECILGKHPPFAIVYDEVSKAHFWSRPFHRNWALKSEGNNVFLVYKGRTVAMNVSPSGGADFVNCKEQPLLIAAFNEAVSCSGK